MRAQSFGGRVLRTPFSPELHAAEAFRREVAQWFYASHQCRIDICLPDSENTNIQRGFISSLIAWGEWAQLQIAEKHIDLSTIGVTVEDVIAETKMLRITYRSLFDNCLSEVEADTVLKEVFG